MKTASANGYASRELIGALLGLANLTILLEDAEGQLHELKLDQGAGDAYYFFLVLDDNYIGLYNQHGFAPAGLCDRLKNVHFTQGGSELSFRTERTKYSDLRIGVMLVDSLGGEIAGLARKLSRELEIKR